MQGQSDIRRITCVCGKVLEGDDDAQLWAEAQSHLAAEHPELVGQVSREDVLGRAQAI